MLIKQDNLTEPAKASVDPLDQTLYEELLKGGGAVELTIEAPKLSEEEVDITYTYEEAEQHLNLAHLNLEDDDDDWSNVSPFEVIAASMTPLTSDHGVMKKVKREGSGPAVSQGSKVYVHYNMYLELEEVPFDSSYLRNDKTAHVVVVGKGEVFPGFEIAISSMTLGEKAQFLVSPLYAFREMGVPPRIPPNSTILIEADVVKVFCGTEEITESSLGGEEDLKSFPAAMKKAKSLHLRGNEHFQSGSHNAASNCYRMAAKLMENCAMDSDEQEAKQRKLLMKLYRNMCICFNKMSRPQLACMAAKDALATDPVAANHDAKLHFNWGKALIMLHDYSRSADHLKKARSLNPNCKATTDLLVELEHKRKEQLVNDKIRYKKALGLDQQTSPNHDPLHNTKALSSSSSQEDQYFAQLETAIREFHNSSRSRLELPSSLTMEEKDFIRRMAADIGLVFQENNQKVALTK